MEIRHLEIKDDIWKDKRIPKETKLVYTYIYTKGFERIITDNKCRRDSKSSKYQK